ncbi:MAG TPA: aminotransferase class V-fold PLP-dependent enzyme [Bacteroidota bacterium]|nr:aminotransferase class V-fold PLP-dependent enzyme [Bacteroidota bacterium]
MSSVQPITPDSKEPRAALLPHEALERARELYPLVGQGIIYLNHAATGPLSTRVIDAMSRYYRERSAGRIDTYELDVPVVAECRSLVQRLIRAKSSDRIALVASTSDALNIVASGLRWRSGDRIVLNNIEFPANIHPYMSLKRHGVEIDLVDSPDGRVAPDMIEHALTPRTRLVGISAVQFLSGYRADLRAIGAICRERNIVFVVDGIQAVGSLDIDVEEMKIDALAAGSQKWIMGPHGTGFLYVTEALQEQIEQQYVGWLSMANPWNFYDYKQPLAASARRYEGGSLNYPGLWGLRAALRTLTDFGTATIEGHIRALTQILTDEFERLDMFAVYSPISPTERAGIVTVQPAVPLDIQSLFESMQSRNIRFALREGRFRFAPHFYNTPDEVRAAAAALSELVVSVLR